MRFAIYLCLLAIGYALGEVAHSIKPQKAAPKLRRVK